MGISEQEALARQLYKIHEEALGTGKAEWELESPAWREAWIQVAQYVEATYIEPLATEMNQIKRINAVQVDTRFREYEGIIPKELLHFYDEPDHK
jgi:hypothetical protein